jgi:MFS family permease
VVVGYLVAATVAAPVSGTLGDVFGRRRVMIVALWLFLSASILCSVSVSLEMLVTGRIVQGLGGGALATCSHALIGETVPPRERGRYQGYLASVVVTASTAGPVFGGVLTANFGWRSVFAASIPLVLLAMLLARRLPSNVRQSKTWRLDAVGLLLFVLAVAAFLLMLDRIRAAPLDWSALTTVLLGVSLLALILLLKHERRQPEPLIPLQLLRLPTIRIGNTMAFCHGASLVALVMLLPIYLRVMHGLTIEVSSFMLLPLTVSIGFGSFVAGRVISRTGYTALIPSIGLVVATGAILLLCAFVSSIGVVPLMALLVTLGLSMGPTMAVVQLTVQVATGNGALGVAAGFVQFSRSVGAALGTALVSTTLFATIQISRAGTEGAFASLIENGAHTAGSAASEVAANGFRAAFLAIAAFTALGALFAWRIPLRRV